MSWKKEFGNSRKTQLPSVLGATSAAADPAFSGGDATKVIRCDFFPSSLFSDEMKRK